MNQPGWEWVRCEADHKDGGVCTANYPSDEECPRSDDHA